MQVYVIMGGEYSEKRPIAVFSNMDLALNYISYLGSKVTDEPAWIEEFEIDNKEIAINEPRGRDAYKVIYDPEEAITYAEKEDIEEINTWDLNKIFRFPGKRKDDGSFVKFPYATVIAKDEDEAKKIFYDAYAKYKAGKEGI